MVDLRVYCCGVTADSLVIILLEDEKGKKKEEEADKRNNRETRAFVRSWRWRVQVARLSIPAPV